MVKNFGYDFFVGISIVNFAVARSKKNGYDMATIFKGWGVRELLATMWLRYRGVGGSTQFSGYVVFGQPLGG